MSETPMPVTLYSAASGETQTVASAIGYDPAEWIEVTAPPGLGWRYDGTAWQIVAPPQISSLDFINLFTLQEQLAAYASDDAAVKLTIGQTQAAGVIHLDDPRVADGLHLLESVGIIDAARIPDILSGVPPA